MQPTEAQLREIDQRLAEELMGWTLVGRLPESKKPLWFDDEEWVVTDEVGRAQPTFYYARGWWRAGECNTEWKPTEDQDQALICLEKILERGWQAETAMYLTDGKRNNDVRFLRYVWDARGGRLPQSFAVSGECPLALAICQAIIQILDAERRQGTKEEP